MAVNSSEIPYLSIYEMLDEIESTLTFLNRDAHYIPKQAHLLH